LSYNEITPARGGEEDFPLLLGVHFFLLLIMIDKRLISETARLMNAVINSIINSKPLSMI
jgi:hypothetical protein